MHLQRLHTRHLQKVPIVPNVQLQKVPTVPNVHLQKIPTVYLQRVPTVLTVQLQSAPFYKRASWGVLTDFNCVFVTHITFRIMHQGVLF